MTYLDFLVQELEDITPNKIQEYNIVQYENADGECDKLSFDPHEIRKKYESLYGSEFWEEGYITYENYMNIKERRIKDPSFEYKKEFGWI